MDTDAPWDRRKRVPLHQQLSRALREDIRAGRLRAGDMLPSEPELSRRHGVSRATVRQALGSLAGTGLVQRIPGKGTFVTPPRSGGSPGEPLTLGLVVTGLSGMFLAEMLDGLRRAASAAQAVVTLAPCDPAPGEEEAALRRLRRQGVAGAIIVPSPAAQGSEGSWRELSGAGFPLVFLDRVCPGLSEGASVTSDNAIGSGALARHLWQLGHRRFGYVLPREYPVSSAQDRLSGAMRALRELGAPQGDLRVVAVGGGYHEPMAPHAREATDRLLGRPDAPTAILCANDDIAIHVLAALRQHGLRIPEDVAVAGFDDLPFAQLIDPPLTTVRQFPAEMGARATGLLLAMVREGRTVGPRLVLPVELCVRRSTTGAAAPTEHAAPEARGPRMGRDAAAPSAPAAAPRIAP